MEAQQTFDPNPKPPRFRFSGRKGRDPRTLLSGILFILKTGIAWDDLPAAGGWGCGIICQRYLHRGQRQGVWQKVHEVLLAESNGADRIAWSRATSRQRQRSGVVRQPGHWTEPYGSQEGWGASLMV